MKPSILATIITSIAASAVTCGVLIAAFDRSSSSPSGEVLASAGDSSADARFDALSAQIEALAERAELAPVPTSRLSVPVAASHDSVAADSAQEVMVAEDTGIGDAAPWPGGFATPGETVQAILDAGPESEEAAALFERAAEAGQLHELLDAMELALADVPESAEKHFNRATAYYGAARAFPSNSDGNWWVDSNKAFSKALEYDPQHWKSRYSKARNMAFWPVAYGGQAEAIRHFETLAGQQESGLGDPSRAADHPKTYVWLGNLYAQQGQTAKAQAAWERGLAAFPGDSWLTERLTSLQ